MPIEITSLKFTDEYTGSAVAGPDYLMGSVGDKMLATIDVSIYWNSLALKLKSDAAAKTFTRFDNVKWTDCEFRSGDTITISGFGANDGNYTITATIS